MSNEIKIKWLILSLFALITFSCFAIAPISAYTITTDEITTSSIVWNISEISAGAGVAEIALDGITLSDVSGYTTKIVQSDLSPDEMHIITVIDMTWNVTEATATTLPKPTTQSETLFTSLNLWILILLALLFVVGAVYVRVPFLAFVGALFCLIGLAGSVNNNFITGFISVIMIVVCLFIGFSELS